MIKRKVLKLMFILGGSACIMLVLGAPLPGEVSGCESNEVAVDKVEYCKQRCAIKAWKEVTDCKIFGENSNITEQQIYEQCYSSMQCDNPQICEPECQKSSKELCEDGTYWKPFISTSEAENCLEAWRKLDCKLLNESYIPYECRDNVICDPE